MVAPDDAAVINARALNGPAPDESADDANNRTHHASDPDPPDGKAA